MDEMREDVLKDEERRAIDALPRESHGDRAGEDRLVRALRAEGFFRVRSRWAVAAVQLAAAVVLLVIGGAIGSRRAQRTSLEAQLERKDLTVSERVLLLQRSGSAYVRAAQSYADAAKSVDSTAVEVASAVLIGAAQAVARADMDGGLSPRLASLLASPASPSQIIRY